MNILGYKLVKRWVSWEKTLSALNLRWDENSITTEIICKGGSQSEIWSSADAQFISFEHYFHA